MAEELASNSEQLLIAIKGLNTVLITLHIFSFKPIIMLGDECESFSFTEEETSLKIFQRSTAKNGCRVHAL